VHFISTNGHYTPVSVAARSKA